MSEMGPLMEALGNDSRIGAQIKRNLPDLLNGSQTSFRF